MQSMLFTLFITGLKLMPILDKIDNAFNFNAKALDLRVQRQKVLANNIANADTPNFKARDFDFGKALAQATKQGPQSSMSLTTTSDRHIHGSARKGSIDPELRYRVPDQTSMDGNTVDMDRERTQFADNSVRYQASLTMMGRSIQGLKSAMQPE